MLATVFIHVWAQMASACACDTVWATYTIICEYCNTIAKLFGCVHIIYAERSMLLLACLYRICRLRTMLITPPLRGSPMTTSHFTHV